jgi:hypothetical protein
MPSVERRTIANYFAGMCCLQLRRFRQGAAHMEEASQFLEMPEGQSTGLDCAEALALAAYLRYLAVVYAERDVHAPGMQSSFDESEQRAGLEKARTLIDGALALRKGDQADRESAIRSHTIAACIYFRLGIAAVGAAKLTWTRRIWPCTGSRERGVGWSVVDQRVRGARARGCAGGGRWCVRSGGAAAGSRASARAQHTLRTPRFASASDVFVAEGDSSSDSDGEAGNATGTHPSFQRCLRSHPRCRLWRSTRCRSC